MSKSTLRQQYDAAVAKYVGMLAKPPEDIAYYGDFTKAWLDNCDAQKRVVAHLKNALKLKEPRNGTSPARRK